MLFVSLFICFRGKRIVAMTPDELERWINKLIEEKRLDKFYRCREWRKLSDAVMKENNYECQHCKARGLHTAARSVHHVQWVWRHPSLALSREYTYKGKTYANLVPLCENCHNKEHNKCSGLTQKKESFTNEERW